MPSSSSVFPVFRPDSPMSASIDHLFILVLVVCAVILAVVAFLVIGGLMRYRAKPGEADPRPSFGHRNLEITWTVIPFLIVTWLSILTVKGIFQSDPSPAGHTPDLVVVGHQWWWEARYPSDGLVTANEIHMPVGRRWLVRLESADVIHDFWCPRLGPKMDMVPGHPNYIWLEADKPGVYHGSCAEYCGVQHANMRFLVIAQPADEFAAWEKRELEPEPKPAGAEAKAGLKIIESMTCVNCHTIRGVPSVPGKDAPDLTHLSDRQTLAAGVLSNTPDNLQKWLQNPEDYKPGCLMPDLRLTQKQAAEVAAYLEEK